MSDLHDGIRKTAILIDSLDQATAEVLLEQLSFNAAVQVRQALLELGDVEPQERERVLSEFLDAGSSSRPEGSVAESDETAKAPAEEEFVEVPVPNEPRDDAAGLSPVESSSAAALAQGLAQEHPQTICLVVANLPPQQASDVLQRLSPVRRTEVLQRLAQFQTTAPEVLQDLGEELQPWGFAPPEWVPQHSGRATPGSGSIPLGGNDVPPGQTVPLADVVTGESPAARRMDTGENPPLAEFDDLVRLEDAALARVFAAAAPEVVLLALSGANRELIDRIVCRLPTAAGRTLRRQLEAFGPTRLRDIEAAQQQLAELAGQMSRDGLIHVPNRRRFTMAA